LVASVAAAAWIPGLITLTTLADVRELLEHLPRGHRERSTWQHVAACLNEAAASGSYALARKHVCATMELDHARPPLPAASRR
jgi:hypothetical protein